MTGAWIARRDALADASAARAFLRARLPAFFPDLPPRLAIVGAADEGRRLVGICRRLGIEVAAIADDDPARRDTEVDGVPVVAFEALMALDRATPVVVASHRLLAAIRRLRAAGFGHACGFAALEAADPDRFPPHMFYDGWFEDLVPARDRHAALATRLADARSRAVLDAVTGFRLTLDPELLAPVLDTRLYGADDLPFPPDPSVYVDAGAYDGDTVRLYLARWGERCERVHAFEPDPATYARLAANFAGDARVVAHNAGLSRREGTLAFRADATRGAILDPAGGTSVRVVALDDVLQGGEAGVVKLNIEGAEIDALHGAAGTLRRHRPSLIVSLYHRPADLWRIPETLDALATGYRFYLRQHDGGTIETVLYALPAEA
jgi:FkbM family methyltransferase